jgi:hypothetical protein
MEITQEHYSIIESDKHAVFSEWARMFHFITVLMLPWLLYKEMARPDNEIWHEFSKSHPNV